MYDSTGKSKHESAAQLLFYGVADSYCAANNIDLSPESNAGRGPVDFKLSRGSTDKVIVEVKLTSNEPERLKDAAYMIVVRAVFSEDPLGVTSHSEASFPTEVLTLNDVIILSQKGYFYPCSAPFDYSLAEKKHPLSTRQRVFLFNEINPFRDL